MHLIENPDFLHLPAATQALFARAAERSFFALPLWYHVLSHNGTDKANVPRLYLDNETAPALALVCQQRSESRRLTSLSTYYSTEHGPIYGSGEPRLVEALTEIAHGLARARPAWHALQLSGLTPADPAYQALATSFAKSGWAVFPYFDSGTWYENTGGLDFARYLAELPSTLRNTWKRRSAKLASEGRARIVVHEDASDIDRIVEEYNTVYAASWKESEPFPDFTPALIRAASATGALRLGIMYVDNTPAAVQLWLHWRGRSTIYKLAHDRRFDELSVGTILTMRMMEHTLERDHPIEIDFGRGDDPYKKQWLTKRRERWGMFITNPRTLPGLALTTRERAATALRHWRHWRNGMESR